MSKHVFFFGEGRAEGDPMRRDLLGGKGAGLAEMTSLGLPVPPGFTISTEACNVFSKTHAHATGPHARAEGESSDRFKKALDKDVAHALARVEQSVGAKLGDEERPLLVSVRSGARASMPGMMDTILNLGLNDQTAEALARSTKNRRFAMDAYRRFVAMYSSIALGLDKEPFDRALDEVRARVAREKKIDTARMNPEELKRAVPDSELPEKDLETLVGTFKKIVLDETGKPFPDDPAAQLWGAIEAVFASWNNARAVYYRRLHDIPDDWGTACNVQAMVFGNLGEDSATGVAFTRNPSTGLKEIFGEWLPNAQGEDVVAGIRTPLPIRSTGKRDSLEETMPLAFAQLAQIAETLERHFRDMQDLEFTIQNKRLYMLQCRNGKRTSRAAVRIAVEMVRERLIDQKEAVLRVEPESLHQLLHPTLDPNAPKEQLARGLAASPGAASGAIVFDADEAKKRASQGTAVILVRVETSPEDIQGMQVSRGILTARGGMTCVAPETRVLTSEGFLTAEETFSRFEEGAPLRLLSFDSRAMRPVWRDVVAAGRKPGDAVTVAVSQTGRVSDNTLRLTSDHKMLTIERRRLCKKPLAKVLEDDGFVTVVDGMPSLGETATSPALAYVAGAILSDGYINLKPTKGSVTFVQKSTPEKADFIAAVEQAFERAFGCTLAYVRERETMATLRGRVIRGHVEDRICFKREPAARLAAIRERLSQWVLTLDRTALLHFLAGYVDGDGTYAEESSAVRLQIVIAGDRPWMLEGVTLACLRLGIVPQVTRNRDAFLVQIAEQVDEITSFTNRVRPEIPPRAYASRCLAIRGLFDDIVDDVNFMGRVREGLKRNIMFGHDKIRRDILPLCPAEARHDLAAILDAPLRSYRVKQTADAEPTTVYNFEVDATDEIDKCFVVFSSRMTPVLVSNSHAAVVARGMGKPCVAGTTSVQVRYDNQTATFQLEGGGTKVMKKGDALTIDGGTGEVFSGAVPTVPAGLFPELEELMTWADEHRALRVRANADTPHDARTARAFGAEGIGLCRTEHMFFGEERITAVREMIVAETKDERQHALDKLLPFQRNDFVEIFEAMNGLPVTIRLLDPPLHEFLPTEPKQIEQVAKGMGVAPSVIAKRAKDLHEQNPMLGHRGCRLAITYPEIYAMQARAILEAAKAVAKDGVDVHPEIMIPLAISKAELDEMRRIVDAVAKEVGDVPAFHFGTMIELPRAALLADELAETAEFFSFGTNDLTQATLGLSRDDAGRFLPAYVEHGILPKDPFVSIDQVGVGELVKTACERGKKTRAKIKLGVCGEHGGDPASIAFFHAAGLAYVSCSPFRVIIARLAAAQVAVKKKSSHVGTA